MNTSKVGQRIRAKRIAADLTQKQLGEAVGLHKNTIGAIERGKAPAIGLGSIIAIARALDTKPAWFLAA